MVSCKVKSEFSSAEGIKLCENNSSNISFSIFISPQNERQSKELLENAEKFGSDSFAVKLLELFTETVKKKNESFSVEKSATKILCEFGIPANTKGYRYLREAIILVTERAELIESVTGSLYPEIAKKHNSTPARVERVIRHAIENCCLKGDIDKIYTYFPHCITSEKGKPTNSQFIAVLSDELRMRWKTDNKWQTDV